MTVFAVMSVHVHAAGVNAPRRAYYEAYISYDLSRVANWKFPKYILLGETINLPYTINSYGDDLNNVVVALMVNGEEADKNQIASIVTDEDMGEGMYTGQFSYTPAALGELQIQLTFTFDGADSEEGEYESELLTISVVNEPPAPDVVPNIAALKLGEGGDVLLTLDNAKVTYSGTVEVFDYDVFSMVTTDVVVFEDATAGISLQGSGLGSLVKAGQILNGSLAMTTDVVWSAVTAKLTMGIEGVEVTDGEITPLVLTSDNVSSFLENSEWRLITLNDVKVKKVANDYGEEKYYLTSDLIGEYELQNTLGASISLPEEGESVKVTGYIFSTFAGLEYAFQPLEFTSTATSIGKLQISKSGTPAYLLNGIRAEKVNKGLYIIDGRKVFIK